MSQSEQSDNRPGQSALSYRVTSRDASFQRMVARLHSYLLPSGSNKGSAPLAQLTTRDSSDPAIALLDAWAAVLDVMSFYEERIANEGYLRTATEDFSVWQLVSSIGYKPAPALSASTHLAYTLSTAAGNPESVAIPQGSQIKSVPAAGELPQVFETAADFVARGSWNELHALTSCPQLLTTSSSDSDGIAINCVRLSGVASGVHVGAVLRLCDTTTVRVDQVVTQATKGCTDLFFTLLDGPPLRLQPPPALPVGDPSRLPQPFKSDAITQEILRGTWTEESLSGLLAARGVSAAELMSQVAALQKQQSVPQVALIFRQSASFFGADAPAYASLPFVSAATLRGGVDLYGTAGSSWDVNGTPPTQDTDPPLDLRNKRTIWVDSWGSSYRSSGAGCDLYLSRNASGIVPGSSLLLCCPRGYAAMTIASVVNTTVRGYGATARTTGLLLTAAPSAALADSGLFLVRDTTAYLQSEVLPLLATVPLPQDAAVRDAVLLDTLVLGLAAGQPIVVSGEPLQAPGARKSELVRVAAVSHVGGYTKIYFQQALSQPYRGSTITISANVVPATCGQTIREEILGSGDASQVNQRFLLTSSPLSYLPAVSATGSASTLQVRVGGVLWNEVPWLLDQDGRSPCYVVQRDPSGQSSIVFGDGVHGAVLPTGQANIVATYRVGGGPGGNVAAAQVSMPVDRPIGVRAVKNPLPASGGIAAETAQQLRENAPLSARTLGRVVSLSDYQAMAGAFPGVAKALAGSPFVAGAPVVHLTVATEDGTPLLTSSALYQSLLQTLRAVGNPVQGLILDDYRQRRFRCKARLVIDRRWLAADVLASARAALRTAFSFAARDFGQPLHVAQVYYLLQRVPGVVGVLLDALHYSDARPMLNATLEAAMAQVDITGHSVGAELLVLELLDDSLEIMA